MPDEKSASAREDTDRLSTMRADLVRYLQPAAFDQAALDDVPNLAAVIVSEFVEVVPPRIDLRVDSEMVHVTPHGGSIVHPRMLAVNPRRLLSTLLDGAMVASAATNVLMLPLAAVGLFRLVKNATTVQISERHALVIWAMWRSRTGEFTTPKDAVRPAVDELTKKYGRSPISDYDLEHAIDDLVALGVVDTPETHWAVWEFHDSVEAKY